MPSISGQMQDVVSERQQQFLVKNVKNGIPNRRMNQIKPWWIIFLGQYFKKNFLLDFIHFPDSFFEIKKESLETLITIVAHFLM